MFKEFRPTFEGKIFTEDGVRLATYAGLLAFSGLLHVKMMDEYRHQDEIMHDLRETIARAKEMVLDERDDLVIPYREAKHPTAFHTIQRDVRYAFAHEDMVRMNIRSVLGYEEYFVEGVSFEDLEKGQKKYDALVLKYQALRLQGWEIEDIVNEMLKERGEYEKEQTSMFLLLVRGKGNCQARAKLFASLLQDVFPEYDTNDWVLLEVYRGYVDALGEEHPGHVRVVLNFSDTKTWVVVEGNAISDEPRIADNIPRPSAQEVFVEGSARAMHVLPEETRFGFLNAPSSDQHSPLSLSPHHNPGIVYPESSVPWLGSADESETWIPRGTETSIDSQNVGWADVGGVPFSIRVEPLETLSKQVEKDRAYGAALSRVKAVIDQYADQGVRFDVAEMSLIEDHGEKKIVVIFPLSASEQARRAVEAARAKMLKENPEYHLWIFYEVTREDEALVPLVNPNERYLFATVPTEEQMKNAGSIFVSDVDVLQRDAQWKTFREDQQRWDGSFYNQNILLHHALTLPTDADLRRLPFFRALIDISPEASQITFPSGDLFLRNPRALEGKTVHLEDGSTLLALEGALPNIHKNNSDVIIEGPFVVWGEGVSLKESVGDIFSLSLSSHDLSFERRAFSGVEMSGVSSMVVVYIPVDSTTKFHVDPEMFLDVSANDIRLNFYERNKGNEQSTVMNDIERSMHEVDVPDGWEMSFTYVETGMTVSIKRQGSR